MMLRTAPLERDRMSNEQTDESGSMRERPNAQEFPANEQDVTQIEDLFAELEAGFNQKDAAMLDRPFTADAVVVAPDGTMVQGWDELYAYHTARLEEPASDWHTTFSVLNVRFLSQRIAVVQTQQNTTTPEREFTNHGTAVMTKKDEEWWISTIQLTTVVDEDSEDDNRE